jgi:hypothetical protein
MIDYDRVATVLRSIGTLIYGYEEWVSDFIDKHDLKLSFHLNLGEFPSMSSDRFLTPALMKWLFHTMLPDELKRGIRGSTYHEILDIINRRKVLVKRVPITVVIPEIKAAIETLVSDERATRVLGPLIRPDVIGDISIPTNRLSSFHVLQAPASDKVARTPRNATYRILVPWLRILLPTEAWIHNVSILLGADKKKEASKMLADNFDVRIPRIVYDIIKLHTPIERNIWRILLRWLFTHSDKVPRIGITDPTSAYFAALATQPDAILAVFRSSYYTAMTSTSHFSKSDLFVSSNLCALESINQLRTSLYKRVSTAYAKRYYAHSNILTTQLKNIDKDFKGNGPRARKRRKGRSKTQKEERKEVVSKITMYQWRAKVYPSLLPVGHDGEDFDHSIYMTHVYDMLDNYTRKRKYDTLAKEITTQQELFPTENTTLQEQLMVLGNLTGLDLMASFYDVMERRNMTLQDINNFIVYEKELDLNEDELVITEALRFPRLDVHIPETDFETEQEELSIVLSDTESDPETLPTTIPDNYNPFAFLSAHKGLESSVPVSGLYWDLELEEQGYGVYWSNLASAHFNLKSGEIVSRSMFDDILIFVKSNWFPRYDISKSADQAALPDIS